MIETPFAIEELVERVEEVVDAAELPAPNGSIADRLTVRNVRYYASLGLLAPPVARRGRQVLYSDEHVDQLVAIKRLQAEGLHLAEIQRALTGLSAREVSVVAAGSAEPAERFWTTHPAAPSEHPLGSLGQAVAAVSPPPPATPDAHIRSTASVYDLAPGIALQLQTGAVVDATTIDQVLTQVGAVLHQSASPAPRFSPNRPSTHRQKHRP